jgi:hypothetical protein
MAWHGGPSYTPTPWQEASEYPSLEAARTAFEAMTSADSYYPGAYVDAPADERPSAVVFLYDPRTVEDGDPYPDHLFEWDDDGDAVIRPA